MILHFNKIISSSGFPTSTGTRLPSITFWGLVLWRHETGPVPGTKYLQSLLYSPTINPFFVAYKKNVQALGVKHDDSSNFLPLFSKCHKFNKYLIQTLVWIHHFLNITKPPRWHLCGQDSEPFCLELGLKHNIYPLVICYIAMV